MFKGFKEFITRGNVVDLAVAVVIGTAFTAIVTAFVESVVNPLIGALVPSGDLETWVVTLPGIFEDPQFGIGAILAAIINFIAVALVVYFAIVMPMNAHNARRAARHAPADEAPAAPTQEELLTEIRDLLARQR